MSQRGSTTAVVMIAERASDLILGRPPLGPETFEAFDPQGLPKDDKIQAAINRVATQLVGLLKAPVVFDGRNIYSPEHMRALGFTYISIGR